MSMETSVSGRRQAATHDGERSDSRGFLTLLTKELMRAAKVGSQTIGAPVMTAVLYLAVFAHVSSDRAVMYRDLPYSMFLVPGLVMMSIQQNAFANTSSSLIQSRITGNLVFVLLSPLSHWEFFGAYVLAAMIRGLLVGLGVWLVTMLFVPVHVHAFGWIALFALIGSAVLAILGLIAGIWAEKFDQIATFQTFVVMPATFLAGVFFSIHSLPPFWQNVSHLNPFFYMVDGLRYGFFGVSDVPPAISLLVAMAALGVSTAVALQMVRSGYKLRQ